VSVGAATGLIAVAVCVLSFGACSKSAVSSPPAVFEIADVSSADDPAAVERPWYFGKSGTVHVANVERFEIESATVQPNFLGEPAVAFKLIESQRAAFSIWTGARMERNVAMLLDGRIVLCATLRDPRPGECILDFGHEQPSSDELHALVEQ